MLDLLCSPRYVQRCEGHGRGLVRLGVEYRPVEQLIPYAANARTHNDEQVAQIAASIRQWGFTNPIRRHRRTRAPVGRTSVFKRKRREVGPRLTGSARTALD